MRYRIEWTTTIREERDGALTRYPVRGFTIVNAEDIDEARVIADNLVDVDFFAPGGNYSASDRRVESGAMWPVSVTSPGLPDLRPALGDLLPNVEEWAFEDIQVWDVTALEVTV